MSIDLVTVILTSVKLISFLSLYRYREQIEKVTRLREETVRAIIKNCSDIVMFKESVSQHLKHLQEYAEAN